jgi:O-methyltransferase
MNLLSFIKNNLFIQNFFSSLVALIHPFLENTLSKYTAIKKAMFMNYHDNTFGDYLEFGVFTGSSFNFAMKINKKMEGIFNRKIETEFVGFDSFDGFGDIKPIDINPTFKSDFFKINKKKVFKNIKKNSKNQKFRLIEGFYNQTLENKNTQDYGIDKSRIIMIDCDLKESTTLALNFSKPSLQEGTIIIFDDFNFYKGNTNKGEYGAFEDFKKRNLNIKFRRVFDYGYCGRAFIVTDL